MKNLINQEDIYWTMDWSQLKDDGTRRFPDKPEKELIFERDFALALLLINEVVFINNYWWMDDWPDSAKNAAALTVCCNDTFFYASADGELINHDEIQSLYDLWVKDEVYGPIMWCILKRKMLPLPRICEEMKERGYDLDSLGFTGIPYE